MSKPIRPKDRPRVFMVVGFGSLRFLHSAVPVQVEDSWYWIAVEKCMSVYTGKPYGKSEGYKVSREQLHADYDACCREPLELYRRMETIYSDGYSIKILDPAFSDTEAGI